MKPAYLRGLGLWTPEFANPEAWCRSEADPEATKPQAKRNAATETKPPAARIFRVNSHSPEILKHATSPDGAQPARQS